MSTNRREFIGTALCTTAAVTAGMALEAKAQGRGPFAKVRELPMNLRRIPSDSYPLPFSDQEYRNRLKRTREMMDQLEIDLLYVTLPEGMCYLHGYEVTWYRAMSPKHWFPVTATAVHVDHDDLMFLSGESAVPTWAEDRRRIGGDGTLEGGARAAAKLLADAGWLKSGTRLGQEFWSYLPNRAVSEAFSNAFAEKGAVIVDGSDVMRQVRIIKSPAEIEAIEIATQIADLGHKAIAEGFRPGMSHAEVYALAIGAMHAAGGEVPGIPQGVIPTHPKSLHLLPNRRTIEAGEPFVFDLAGVYKRYHSNIARTYYWGDPSPELRRLSDAARGGIETLIATARAGTPISVVSKAMRDFYREAGVYDIRGYSGGYDIGIAFPPDWVGDFEFNINREDQPGTFQANMTTQYECALQNPDPGRKYEALANNIETFVYGETTRMLSNIDLGTVWLG